VRTARPPWIALVVTVSLVTAPVSHAAMAPAAAEPAAEEAADADSADTGDAEPAEAPEAGAPTESTDSTEDTPPAEGDETLAEAKRLYEQGKAHYEMLDYQAAIDAWTKAYAAVPQTERGEAIRNALVYNIAQAQEKAFEIDGDVTHLKQAKGLLERYLEGYVAMYGEDGDAAAEVEKVRGRIAELEARISDSDAGRGPSASDRRRAARAAERKRRAMALELLQKDEKLRTRYQKAKTFVIAGGVLTGVGAVSTVAGVGLATGDLGGSPRPGGWALAAVGFGAFVAGVVMLPIGAVRMKRVRKEALERVTVSAAPVAGRTFAGLALAGRF